MARWVGLFLVWGGLAWAADAGVLQTSKDPRVLLDAALQCARSEKPADQQALLAALTSGEFLTRLDSKQEYLAPPRQLRLAKVLKALMDNPAATRTLVDLAGSRVFTAVEPRQELLIRAAAEVRPAPEPVVRLWEKHSVPGAPYLAVTIEALADNGSEPALALLERRLADRRFAPEDKIAWMRDPILRHRTEEPMLQACERMLNGSLPAALRPRLREALCDYRPEWYLSDEPPHPPDPSTASPAARERLRRICHPVK